MATSNKTVRLSDRSGMGLIASLLILILITGIVVVFHEVVSTDIATVKFAKDSTGGFYAGESAMNIRASLVRNLFSGFSIPSGSGPSTTNPCTSGNMGAGDFACVNYTISGHTITTYVTPDSTNPQLVTVPQGEDYQGLSAQEYKYNVVAISRNAASGTIDSQLEMRFRTRTIPLFQFIGYYNKPMEIFPRFDLTLNGPLHANGDLYLVPGSGTISLAGQVSASGQIWRGARYRNECGSGVLRAMDPTSYRTIATCSNNTSLTTSYLTPWNGQIRPNRKVAVVPDMGSLDPLPANALFSRADLRLELLLTGSGTGTIDTTTVPVSTTGIRVKNGDGTYNTVATTALNACTNGTAGAPWNTKVAISSQVMMNTREGYNIRMLDIDLRELIDCLHATSFFGSGKLISDTTDGGLVIHATVKGPNSAGVNAYGVRLRNGSNISSSTGGAPAIRGLTFVTDQSLYLVDSFNTTGKKPVALLADSLNILSSAFNATTKDAASLSSRTVPANVTINAAMLSGTDNTIGSDGSGDIDSGGLTVFPRLHENWTSRTLTIVGSLVSLGPPRHVDGVIAVGFASSPGYFYMPPVRAWSYDISFNNPANLPPMSLQLVYLKEELFLRDFTQ